MAEKDLAERVRQYGTFLDGEIRFAQRHLENLGRFRDIPAQAFDDVKREIKVCKLAKTRLY